MANPRKMQRTAGVIKDLAKNEVNRTRTGAFYPPNSANGSTSDRRYNSPPREPINLPDIGSAVAQSTLLSVGAIVLTDSIVPVDVDIPSIDSGLELDDIPVISLRSTLEDRYLVRVIRVVEPITSALYYEELQLAYDPINDFVGWALR